MVIDKIISQATNLLRFHFSLYFPALVILGLMVLLSRKMGIPLWWFTNDTSDLGTLHPFAGILSNFGVIVWTATATLCLFGWAALRGEQGDKDFSIFLLCSGLMTTLLLCDDFFRFHESIFPDHLGVNEKVVQLAYVGLILFGMFKFRKPILETDFLILLVALGFFGLSVVIDVFEDQVYAYLGNWKFVFEHGAKFLGIVGWFGYFFRCCILRLKPTEAGSNPTVTN